MLESVVWILLMGFVSGQLVHRFGAPPLIGMILAGIFLGPQVSDAIDASILNVADELRAIAVMIILIRAGLGLDREKLQQQGTVALRLGFLPAIAESLVVALA
ncbi:MAG: cation:proton antiporter, partial [Pseudanabaenales cyanobacterium]|nr:cation:proton antiporter [Pseudanabaenales cyanobacterium]